MRNEKCAAGWSAAATVGCLRRLSRGLRRDARRQHEKAFAQSERARVGGLCEVSPPAVLVRHQPFIGPVGQGSSDRLFVSYTQTHSFTDTWPSSV
jgi:hypothetical protein